MHVRSTKYMQKKNYLPAVEISLKTKVKKGKGLLGSTHREPQSRARPRASPTGLNAHPVNPGRSEAKDQERME